MDQNKPPMRQQSAMGSIKDNLKSSLSKTLSGECGRKITSSLMMAGLIGIISMILVIVITWAITKSVYSKKADNADRRARASANISRMRASTDDEMKKQEIARLNALLAECRQQNGRARTANVPEHTALRALATVPPRKRT